MSRRITNLGLFVALVVAIAARQYGSGVSRRPNFQYFPDMARSVRYNTFAANSNFPDGKTLQMPVAGTMALDEEPAASRTPHAGLPGAAANPFSASDPAAVARGKAVFSTFCQPCHGSAAAGDGPVTKRGLPAPPSLVTGGATTMDDRALFRIISRGSNDMPGYAAQMSVNDRWKAILYVRALQERAPASPAESAVPGARK